MAPLFRPGLTRSTIIQRPREFTLLHPPNRINTRDPCVKGRSAGRRPGALSTALCCISHPNPRTQADDPTPQGHQHSPSRKEQAQPTLRTEDIVPLSRSYGSLRPQGPYRVRCGLATQLSPVPRSWLGSSLESLSLWVLGRSAFCVFADSRVHMPSKRSHVRSETQCRRSPR